MVGYELMHEDETGARGEEKVHVIKNVKSWSLDGLSMEQARGAQAQDDQVRHIFSSSEHGQIQGCSEDGMRCALSQT
jgi:hypothetical protein